MKRAYRDEDYIRALAAEIDRFNAELAEMVEKIRRYKIVPTFAMKEAA